MLQCTKPVKKYVFLMLLPGSGKDEHAYKLQWGCMRSLPTLTARAGDSLFILFKLLAQLLALHISALPSNWTHVASLSTEAALISLHRFVK
jgi:hypothetical protein